MCVFPLYLQFCVTIPICPKILPLPTFLATTTIYYVNECFCTTIYDTVLHNFSFFQNISLIIFDFS